MKTHAFENVLYNYRFDNTSDRFSDAINPDYFTFQRNLGELNHNTDNKKLTYQIYARMLCLLVILSIFYSVALIV